jgi:hypothetical protein
MRRAEVRPEALGEAKAMTAPRWAAVQDLQRSLPEATVILRAHKIAWKRDPKIALPFIFSVLLTRRVGPFTLRREDQAE